MGKRGRPPVSAYPIPPKDIYICFSDDDYLDLSWKTKEVECVVELASEGKTVWDIAHLFDRDPDEVALLVMDLGRKGKISR